MSKKKRVVSAGEWAGGALLRTYIDGRATLMGPGANLAVLSGDDSVSAADVARMLTAAKITRLSDDGVESLRLSLSTMRVAERLELAPPDTVKHYDVLHDLLPQVAEAARLYHNELIATRSEYKRSVSEFKREQLARSAKEIRAKLTRLESLGELSQIIKEELPPMSPRQRAYWHEDAQELAKILSSVADAAGIAFGMRRADSKGVSFIHAALKLVHKNTFTKAAVAQALSATV